MKTWEKIAELDRQYVEARKRLLLRECDSVEIIVNPIKRAKAALVMPKKNATKPSTEESSQ